MTNTTNAPSSTMTSATTIARALALLALGLFTACKPELEVKPKSEGERVPSPRFLISEPAKPSSRPHFDTVKLLDDDEKVLWHLRATEFGVNNGAEEIEYGQTPPEFSEVVAPSPLETGREYVLIVSGTGYGSFTFSVVAGAIVPKQ